jgi:uncharacterized protein YbjT (DUF2867 family)
MSKARAPERIAIFGSTGHIGRPLAVSLVRKAPGIHLRLISRTEGQVPALQTAFPAHEAVQADYLDKTSLCRALSDVQAIFVVTPHFIDEERAMTNLVGALREQGISPHVIRIVGFQPGSTLAAVPHHLRSYGSGVATQHFVAKEVLDASGLPVTYFNLGASMMDNFLRVKALRTKRTLIWPDRLVPYVDPRDVAAAAAEVFLSANNDSWQGVLTLNNGHDLLRGRDVANLMSEVIQSPIEFDGTRESYLQSYSAALEQKFKRADAAEYLWNYFEYERSVERNWALHSSLELILGRKPTTLRAWIDEHRAPLFTAVA